MKKMYYIAHIVVLLSLGLNACAPQTPENNSIQTLVEALGGTPTQAIAPAPNDDDSQKPVDSTPSQPPALLFIENVGQFDPKARFQAKTDLGIAYLAEDVIWLTLLGESDLPAFKDTTSNTASSALKVPQVIATPKPEEDLPNSGVHLRLTFENSNPDARVEGFDPQSTQMSYITGNNEGNWRIDVPVWGGVRYVDFYPGYDLEITSEGAQWIWRLVQKETVSFQPSGFLETINHLMQSGSEINEIRLRIDGAESLELVEKDLIVNTAVGEISLPLPMPETTSASAFSAPEITTTPELPKLDGNEVILPLDTADNTQPTSHESSSLFKVRLALMDFSRAVKQFSPIRPYKAPLTEQPAPASEEIVFSTYLGGSLSDNLRDVAIDDDGGIYVTGSTSSLDYPITPGVFSAPGSEQDFIVSKLNPNGDQLEWSTQIGGNDNEIGIGITLDGSNNIYLTGITWSTDFPVTSGAFDTTHINDSINDPMVAFVMKLSSDGTDLIYSTYLGEDRSQGFDIAVSISGEAYIIGETASPVFPV